MPEPRVESDGDVFIEPVVADELPGDVVVELGLSDVVPVGPVMPVEPDGLVPVPESVFELGVCAFGVSVVLGGVVVEGDVVVLSLPGVVCERPVVSAGFVVLGLVVEGLPGLVPVPVPVDCA
jgi:hypothetical protein